MIMDKTVLLAKEAGVLAGAHPSLPDRQGFGRREMAMDPDELVNCFTYQVGALQGFLTKHGMKLSHVLVISSAPFATSLRSPCSL
jgi:lactam utilization protein B